MVLCGRLLPLYFLLVCWISLGEGVNLASTYKHLRVVSPAKGRIIGGTEVVPHSFKFQVALWINRVSFCGGSLISPRYVLTAAHCGEVISTVEIVLGAHNISNTREATQISITGSKVIMHEKYVSEFYTNDIALIELSKPVSFNQYIEPVKLPSRSDAKLSYEGALTIASGWGLVNDVPYTPSTADLSSVLMTVNLTVSDLEECGEYYNEPNKTFVTSHNLCTSGYRNRGTCNGDSGGPLTLNGVLIGVTSFGTDQCEMCSPSAYTRVVDYLDWIANKTGISV